MKKDTRRICFTIIRLLLSRVLFSIYCVLSVLAVTIYLSNEVYWLLLIPVVPLFLETVQAGKNWNSKNIEITIRSFKSVEINLRALLKVKDMHHLKVAKFMYLFQHKKFPNLCNQYLNCKGDTGGRFPYRKLASTRRDF